MAETPSEQERDDDPLNRIKELQEALEALLEDPKYANKIIVLPPGKYES
jgi:hypothetical protein